MVGAQVLLVDGQRPAHQWFRFGEAGLGSIELGEVVETYGNSRMIRSEGLLVDRQ
jgi:hypothetical protein